MRACANSANSESGSENESVRACDRRILANNAETPEELVKTMRADREQEALPVTATEATRWLLRLGKRESRARERAREGEQTQMQNQEEGEEEEEEEEGEDGEAFPKRGETTVERLTREEAERLRDIARKMRREQEEKQERGPANPQARGTANTTANAEPNKNKKEKDLI